MSKRDDAAKWKRELLAAGWKRHKRVSTLWYSPKGDLYLGPFGAWKQMKKESRLAVEDVR